MTGVRELCYIAEMQRKGVGICNESKTITD